MAAATSALTQPEKDLYALQLTNDDGTTESTVTKLDISTLTGATGATVTQVNVLEIYWNVNGFDTVNLLWDHTSDVVIDVCVGNGYRDYRPYGGLNDTGSGGTGDVLVTTSGTGKGYDIFILFELVE